MCAVYERSTRPHIIVHMAKHTLSHGKYPTGKLIRPSAYERGQIGRPSINNNVACSSFMIRIGPILKGFIIESITLRNRRNAPYHSGLPHFNCLHFRSNVRESMPSPSFFHDAKSYSDRKGVLPDVSTSKCFPKQRLHMSDYMVFGYMTEILPTYASDKYCKRGAFGGIHYLSVF